MHAKPKSMLVLLIVMLGLVVAQARAGDPLVSWNNTQTKKAIYGFIEKVTTPGSPDFVKPEERIAVFDNDGTLWCEQPMYVQLAFALDRIKAMAPQHPEWKEREPFKAVIDGDMKALAESGVKGMLEITLVSHSGMTTGEFDRLVKEWLATARHPRFDKPYTDLVYQPMLELLAYLRGKGFKTYIVTGGGIEFVRAFCEKSYGVPPEQVVGSYGELKLEMKDDKPVMMKEPKLAFLDDGPGKAIGIENFIGRRPIMAFGNSDGDIQMLQYTTAGDGARFGLLVHHTDAEREYAYDRDSKVGRLDKGLDQAKERGWTVVDMKQDWKKIFPLP
jgi:phosphoglycolate phosphatase-like HAD superfamily hydrolase